MVVQVTKKVFKESESELYQLKSFPLLLFI